MRLDGILVFLWSSLSSALSVARWSPLGENVCKGHCKPLLGFSDTVLMKKYSILLFLALCTLTITPPGKNKIKCDRAFLIHYILWRFIVLI